MTEKQIKIVAFLCNWCSYGAADLAGVSRMQYSTDIRVIRVPCSGRIDAKLILAAFREGADGVWVSGCHPGECHYLEGNYYARRKFILMGNLMEHMGIDKNRVHFSWISSAEATKFAKVAREVADTIVPMGPNDRFVKKAV
ncbi:MAG: hydrogenase iron-sulfur subunit [Proteobacteria bacterium]|nr:hydrogenase iron-sulfur subunit [Pseudomonadota bacterium]MBU1386872.1 hydrogenase iron-sulfur subunit [Pseudomonadota bacterium]MBU1541439.1 hydrogenase iron-sulfur subunit [Pseudomonadota bacterium]MBU2480171.1 hydrogenase iron-sulfur subunit [Pseudomonadota bacterium]